MNAGTRAVVWAYLNALIFRPIEQTMSKWHYDKAGDVFPERNAQLIRASNIRTPLLRPVASAFITNFYSMFALWQLKPSLVEHACVTTENIYLAVEEIYGHVTLTDAEVLDPLREQKISQALTQKFERKIEDEKISIHEAVGFDSARAIARFEAMLDSCPSDWEEGLDATLRAMLTGIWTAFEVLASDLWEAALNAHPQKLCTLDGKQDRISRLTGSQGREIQERRREKAFDDASDSEHLMTLIGRATRGTYNAGDVMGTVLREKFPLHKLSGIRKAYSAAFSERTQEIDRILSDKAIDKLNAVRNLLLHKGGIVEEEKFLKEIRKIPWSIPSAEIGKPLPIEGEMVRDLISPVVQLGVDLLLAVDEWVSPKATEATDEP